MFVSAWLSAVPKNPTVIILAKVLGSCLLGGTVLWWVVDHVGPTHGTVLVHVYVPNVEVTVGDRTYVSFRRACKKLPDECQGQGDSEH